MEALCLKYACSKAAQSMTVRLACIIPSLEGVVTLMATIQRAQLKTGIGLFYETL